MGTNYYIIEKSKNKLDKELRELISVIDKEALIDNIENLIKNSYKDVIDYLINNKLEHQLSNFNMTLEETISNIRSNINYNMDYNIDVQEQYAKHIGKSSWGWLFGFQEQDEWHTYKEFKEFITSKEFESNYDIIDEYNRIITVDEMLDLIDTKQSDEHNLSNSDNFKYSENRDGYRFSKGDFS